jgi:hypothetical protein
MGCSARIGTLPVVHVRSDVEAVGIKLLRRGARSGACQVSLLGRSRDSAREALDEALAGLVSQDLEANVALDVEVHIAHVELVLFRRTCVSVHGALGRMVRTVRLPSAEHESH